MATENPAHDGAGRAAAGAARGSDGTERSTPEAGSDVGGTGRSTPRAGRGEGEGGTGKDDGRAAEGERALLDRRDFLGRGLTLGGGALAAGMLGRAAPLGAAPRTAPAAHTAPRGSTRPIIVTSHTNETGRRAMEIGWEVLAAGGTALDAVEKATNHIEVDPEDTSVGYGGLPNAEGVVQLDASVMDGRRYDAGAVAALEGIRTPSSIARLVMERTDHVLLVGRGAQRLAVSFGYPVEELLTEKARRIWLRWREGLSPEDDWGPAEHLRGREEGTTAAAVGSAGPPVGVAGTPRAAAPAAAAGTAPAGPFERWHDGTVNVLAVDERGDVAGITSTSGLSWKLPGRVGDSPILGAGLYLDNEVGAAGATGRGEDVLKACASHHMVLRMREGRSPREACEDALRGILDRYRRVNPDFVPPEKFVALGRDGTFGCSWMGIEGVPRMTVMDGGEPRVIEGSRIEGPGPGS